MKFNLLCLILISIFSIQGQNDELFFLKGKVVAEIKELNDIQVLNSRSESVVTTDAKGDFSLFVKIGDTLKFSGLQIVSKKVTLTQNDVSKVIFAVPLQPKVFELNEVRINEYPEINAVSLGILQKPAKKYTPAERRLRTASNGYPSFGLGMLIGGFATGLDPLINAISGRTAMLKKELEIEKKERLKKKIENYFGEDYFISNLKIPAEYVNGFLYYAVEDEKLVQVASENNKSLMQFQLVEIAVKYLELIMPKN